MKQGCRLYAAALFLRIAGCCIICGRGIANVSRPIYVKQDRALRISATVLFCSSFV